MKKNQTMNETDMQQWRSGEISTQELQKRQAIKPVYPELAIPALRALAGIMKPTGSTLTKSGPRQEPSIPEPDTSPALDDMAAQLLTKNSTALKPTPRGPDYKSPYELTPTPQGPTVLKPTPRGPDYKSPYEKPRIVTRPGETPQQAIDRIQKTMPAQQKLEEFEKNLYRVTNEYKKFKEQISEPTFQATDAQINNPDWMKSQGLVAPQDLSTSISAADAQNRALASAEKAGFPTYQYQGQTYGVKNPQYGQGGKTEGPKPLTPQQIQQMSGTNIKSASGAPVTAGSSMKGPNQAGTSSGSLGYIQENQYRRLINIIEATEKDCPPATQSIDLNLKNRKKAIDEYMYGPMDPNEPNEEYWGKIADEWNMDDIEQAKSARCGNCAAFDITEQTLDCIDKGIGTGDDWDVIEAGKLGYCRFLKFKCNALRTCSGWVEGGPIEN
jgi:hypothetical protein